ncbi:MAG: hypothetical protein GX625_22125 [Clostridiaceae bacterium]|nr:hypothetical protein [Clostridiaceae bacterium]
MIYSLFAFQRGGTRGFVRNRRGDAVGSEGGRRPLDRGRPGKGWEHLRDTLAGKGVAHEQMA